MDNNDILDLRSVSNNSGSSSQKRKRKRGDGSKTRQGNTKAHQKRVEANARGAEQTRQNRFNYDKKQASLLGLDYVSYSSLMGKLDGISDNAERYNIVDKYIADRNKTQSANFGRSTVGNGSGDYFNTPRDFTGPTQDGKKGLKDRFSEGPLGKIYGNFLKNLSTSMPNSMRDVMTASSLGLHVDSSTVGKLGSFMGVSEYVGKNFISGQDINIDYLSDRIGNQKRLEINAPRARLKHQIKGNDLRLKSNLLDDVQKQSIQTENDQLKERLRNFTGPKDENILMRNLKWAYNKHQDDLGKIALEDWKKMHIDETRKYVRNIGDSVDPFDTKGRLGAEQLKEVRARDTAKLKEVEKRIADSQNNIKQFFNPIDQKELSQLNVLKSELTERVRRIDGNYGSERVQTGEIKIPKSVAEVEGALHQKRLDLEERAKQLRGTGNLKDEANLTRVTKELDSVNRQINSRSKEFNSGFSFAASSEMATPQHVKDSYKPSYGTSGFGLGFRNSLAASRTEHFARGMHYLNPFGAGGASSVQATMETFGIMNKQQKMQLAQSRGFSKVMHSLTPVLGASMLFSGMADKKDAGEIFEDMIAVSGSLQGWRTGSAFGAAIGKSNSIGRLAGTAVGGLTGMVAGFALGTAVVGSIRDITSNESNIRSFAKKSATKEMYVGQQSTYQSLTARQASLQKLAKSGLNDRGLLLANEATILATGG